MNDHRTGLILAVPAGVFFLLITFNLALDTYTKYKCVVGGDCRYEQASK